MALIGTISGSNGTTTSSVTGSFIIAANPGDITPIRPEGVVLYVSGAATSIGTDNPSILLKGDAFVSGAFGTDSYIQMKPVNTLRIPTNTTASYIYTSGSTNDLYFTQYSDPYTNTTRLRWIEGVLTTGLLHGGIVSTANGTTTFSVSAGSGLIVTPNATTTEDPYPTIKLVEWPAFTSSSLEYSGSAQVSYITINSVGALAQLNTPPTLAQFKDRIVLGRVLHQTGSVTNGAVNAPAMAFSAAANIFDFVRPFGPLKVSGHTLAASGSTLGLTKTAGDSYAEGRNYAFDPSNPNTVLSADDPALVNCKIYYQYVSGSSTITNTGTGNAGFTVIDPAQYNNNGALAAVGNSEWTNQRVYWFPRSVNRALFVYYGVAKYATLDAAVASIGSEAFVEGSNTKDSAIFVGTVSVRGNETNLSDTVNAKITQAGLFRGSFGGGGGGGTTPPAGSTTQVQFNDAGAFGGDPNFTFDNITHALTVVGAITGSRFTSNAAGSLVTGNGQVYLNGASSNRIDFSSQGTGDPAFNAPTAGTKVVLYPAAGASATDYALGISPATLWQSIPAADAGMMFKWFGGTTTLAALSGSGNMEISGDLAVNGGDITSTAAALNISAGSSGLAFQSSGSPFVTFVSGALGPSQLSTIQASSGKRLVLAAGLGSTQVLVSGSGIDLRTSNSGSPSGIDFTNDVAGSPSSYLNITSGTYVPLTTASTNAAKIIAASSRDLVLGAPAGQKIFISGSSVTLNGGATGVSIQRDAAEILQISSPGSPQVSIVPGSGFTTANLFNVTTTTLNVGGNATSVSLGASTGRTTVNNDLAISTGNIIGAPGAGANVMTLVSSGNIIAKLDTDNNGAGHRFAIQDYRNIDQFSVGENGNAEISGSLVISGSTALGTTVERLTSSTGGTGTVSFDTTFNSIFYVNGPAGDITANFTNVPTANTNRILTPTVILSQSATPRTILAVQVNGTGSSILWANSTTPTATANKQDVFGFSLIRSGSIWTVLGQLSTYG
jgi:hypothetical protein